MSTSIHTLTELPSKRDDYGDWQTSYEFAKSVCTYLKDSGLAPDVIVEPTCGVGNFIAAAIEVFDTVKVVYGVEIFKPYADHTELMLQGYKEAHRIVRYELHNANVFTFNFREIATENQNANILVLGNPPWVTNSDLGKSDGTNLPTKGNFDKVRGIEAITGKGNFDIAENICNLMFDAFSCHENTHIALLVKNSVIKNIVRRQKSAPRNIRDIKQLGFDAKREFNVSVAASLLECHIGRTGHTQCTVYDFYSRKGHHKFGWAGDAFTSNIDHYERTRVADGRSPLVWRSGVKHDCSKVMEFTQSGGVFLNGLNEIADVDPSTVYPLLKSSDLGHGVKQEIKGVRKYLLLPQTSITEDTAVLQTKAPKTYTYLTSHAKYLDGRKSIIYKNKPRFSVFGLGSYSFAPYKIVVSALYANVAFSLIEPIDGKPVMIDDTCYLLGFRNHDHALLTLQILRSDTVTDFIRSVSFADAKRVVNRELLMRIDLRRLAKMVDFSGTGVSKETVAEYQAWLSGMEEPNLFE